MIWIDVGAHLGEHTLEPAKADSSLKVYAFEPNHTVAQKLKESAPPNFKVYKWAVSDRDASHQPFYLGADDQQSSLLASDYPQYGRTLVQTIRLDTFLTDKPGPIDWLKVDTQGHDLAVLRGCGSRLWDVQKVTLEVNLAPKRPYQGQPSKAEVLGWMTLIGGFRLTHTQSWGIEEDLTFERET